MILIFYS